MSKIISERSVQLIKQYADEINLTFPMDDEGAGYAILKFFELMDAEIGGQRSRGIVVDSQLIADVNQVIDEFLYDGKNEIDYVDLERRLKN